MSKKGNAKECSHYCTTALISHTSKLMLKILQARLQQYVNHELPDVQAGLDKAEEPEIKLPTSAGSWTKQESSRKTSISALLTTPKPLTVWVTTNCGKVLDIEITNHLTYLLRNLYVAQEATELDIEQRTGSKLGKEFVKAVYCPLAYLTYMQHQFSSVQSLSRVQLFMTP